LWVVGGQNLVGASDPPSSEACLEVARTHVSVDA
jgi:hypothetical protein